MLAQQIVAEVAAREWPEGDLFDLVRARSRTRTSRATTFTTSCACWPTASRRGAATARRYVHRDAVNGVLRGRRGARLTALTSGGAIPDTADYDVVLEPADTLVGTVNEDFAVESLAGDIFQLGNTSYRIRRVEAGRVRVEDAHGQAPTIPFWLGEAPARSDELSRAVARLRAERRPLRIDDDGRRDRSRRSPAWTSAASAAMPASSSSSTSRAARAALGVLPTQDDDRPRALLRRIRRHAARHPRAVRQPHQPRVGPRAAQALLRKFNFELQAAATEDAIVLSLSTSHSFPLDDVARYLQFEHRARSAGPGDARRADVRRALALERRRRRSRCRAFAAGKKVAAPLQRMRAEDLIAAVFPDQIACAENLVGEREMPDHPLVRQADPRLPVRGDGHRGARAAAAAHRGGRSRDRRARPAGAVAAGARDPQRAAVRVSRRRAARGAPHASRDRRGAGPTTRTAATLGALDAAAIDRVRAEAWPEAAAPTRCTTRCSASGSSPPRARAMDGWPALLDALAATRRATRVSIDACVAAPGGTHRPVRVWVAAERLPQLDALHPRAARSRRLTAPAEFAARAWTRDEALVELVRSRLEGLGPVTAQRIADSVACRSATSRPRWQALATRRRCDGGRLHAGDRRTNGATARCLRASIATRSSGCARRSSPSARRISCASSSAGSTSRPDERGGTRRARRGHRQLQGFEAPAAAWESEILPARLEDYDFTWLDDLCLSGRAVWTRFTPPAAHGCRAGRTPSARRP